MRLCGTCHSPILVAELRQVLGNGDHALRSVPLGTVSSCPVHGAGFPIARRSGV